MLEQEFAQVLKVLAREGNTLSPVVRQAWDSKPLQTMVRHSPLRAREAHIAIVGHITRDELLRYLNATELANGFFNRFLLIAVDRSKLLPFGGTLQPAALTDVSDRLRAAVRFAQTPGRSRSMSAPANAGSPREYPDGPRTYPAYTSKTCP